MSTNSLSLYHYPITPPGLVIKGMNGPGVNHLPFPISEVADGHPEAGPSHPEAGPSQPEAPSHPEAAPSDPEALSHPDAVGVEGPLAVWKKESYWKTWKKEQDAKQDWKKEDWPKESWKQVWKKEGWKKEGWKKEDWPQEDPEDAEAQEYWGGNAWEKHYLPDAWKKERGSKGKKRKAWIEGQIMSLKQEGRWVGGEPSASSKQLRLMREDCWFCSICMLGGE